MIRFGFAIIGLICMDLSLCQDASSQPVNQGKLGQKAQWKPSLERPNLDWDYDGKRILGHRGYDICLWDAKTGKLLKKMKGHQERIQAVQFSRDDNHALSSSWISPGPILLKSKDTSIILWNLATGRAKYILRGQVAGAFSPDGKRIVTFSQRSGELSPFDAAVWETYSGRQIVKVKLDDGYGDPYWGSLHFSPDGRNIVRTETRSAVLYNANDGREIGRANARMAISVRYTSKGTLASFDSQRFKLIDTKSDQSIRSIQHSLKGGHNVAWTHDGSKVVAIPYGEDPIKFWNLESGKMITGAKSGPYPMKIAIISPNNSYLAISWGGTNNVDSELGIYDMNTGEEITRIKLAKEGHILGFSQDSKTLLVGGSEYDDYNFANKKRTILPEFVIYNSENGKKIRTLNLLDEIN